MSAPIDSDALHKTAHQAYLAGQFKTAVRHQVAVVNHHASQGEPSLYHTKILTLYLFSLGDYGSAETILNDLKERHPEDAEVLENLGVIQRKLGKHQSAIENLLAAAERAPEKPNIQDALAHSFGNLGDLENARRHGERSLEIKDHEAATCGTAYPIPDGPPPTFDFSAPEKHIIAFSLFGDSPRYLDGAIRNATLAPDLYPGWTCRFYVDATVPETIRQQLELLGSEVKMMSAPKQFFEGLFWRFHVMSDPEVTRFLIRDADSVINTKERVAVDEWLASDRYFHLMRDFCSHTEVILAGMWGGVGGVLPDVNELLAALKTDAGPTSTYDQIFLRQMVWPTVRQSVMIHDSMFRVFDARPYPLFGALPPNKHIGQNEAVLRK